MNDDIDTYTCPNCGKDIPALSGWCLGHTLVCPHCQCECEVDGDYCDGEGGWAFWLIETDEWVAKQRAKDETKIEA